VKQIVEKKKNVGLGFKRLISQLLIWWRQIWMRIITF